MKLEVLHPPRLSATEQALCDMHSFRNVLTTIGIELFLLAQELGDPRCLERAVQTCKAMVNSVARFSCRPEGLTKLLEHRNEVASDLDAALRTHAVAESRQAVVNGHVTNLRQLFQVVEAREEELLSWEGSPYRWRTFPIAGLQTAVKQILATMADLSHGRYGIVFSAAERTPRDFLVELDVSSVDGDAITMPSILSDVYRDLVANARKYSRPGSRILARLRDDGQQVDMEVADEGRGIPADEILAVVEFGVRGSNVRDVPSRGGGFGLTKAAAACARLGGRTWIESVVGQGTTISLRVPRPAAVLAQESLAQERHSVA